MALNLRKISPELHAKLKSDAALEGKTIEEYVLEILKEFERRTGK